MEGGTPPVLQAVPEKWRKKEISGKIPGKKAGNEKLKKKIGRWT